MNKLKHWYWNVLDFIEDKGYNRGWLIAGVVIVLVLIKLAIIL